MPVLRMILGLVICVLAMSGCQTRDYGGHEAPSTSVTAATSPAARAPQQKPAAPENLAGSDWFRPRSSWAVEKIQLDRAYPMAVKPYRITVHHSAEIKLPDGTRETGDAVAVLRFIEKAHIQGIGKNEPFACIGYHFIIASDGTVYEGRPLQYQGAHATGDNNKGNIGICLLGDFDKHQVPAAQKKSLVEVLDRLCLAYGIKPSKSTVLCHKDFRTTECPGKFLEPVVREYEAGHVSSR